ncbi:MAG: hypothetical protein AAFN11_00175, partial [Chloroflexota bacterium]
TVTTVTVLVKTLREAISEAKAKKQALKQQATPNVGTPSMVSEAKQPTQSGATDISDERQKDAQLAANFVGYHVADKGTGEYIGYATESDGPLVHVDTPDDSGFDEELYYYTLLVVTKPPIPSTNTSSKFTSMAESPSPPVGRDLGRGNASADNAHSQPPQQKEPSPAQQWVGKPAMLDEETPIIVIKAEDDEHVTVQLGQDRIKIHVDRLSPVVDDTQTVNDFVNNNRPPATNEKPDDYQTPVATMDGIKQQNAQKVIQGKDAAFLRSLILLAAQESMPFQKMTRLSQITTEYADQNGIFATLVEASKEINELTEHIAKKKQNLFEDVNNRYPVSEAD